MCHIYINNLNQTVHSAYLMTGAFGGMNYFNNNIVQYIHLTNRYKSGNFIIQQFKDRFRGL